MKTWELLTLGLGLITAIGSWITYYLGLFMPQSTMLVVATCVSVVIMCFILYVLRMYVIRTARVINTFVAAQSGFTMLIILAVCLVTYAAVRPHGRKIKTICFDSGKGAVFNSWQSEYTQGYINACGKKESLLWDINDRGEASFSFSTDASQPRDRKASSGGYITFYAEPFDRLAYSKITFECKVTGAKGVVDVGLRLAVDNPKATGNRELATYVYPSIRKLGTINDQWRHFSIEIGDFTPGVLNLPFPEGVQLDPNTVNKLVWYVDSKMADECSKGTFWFRNVKVCP